MKTNKKIIGCYWGRFNPPHKGHILLIKKLLKKVDKLVVVVGSSQEKNTKRNPFSGNERKRMIQSFLNEEKISKNKYTVITIPDGKSFNSSITNLLFKVPKFDVIFTDKESIIKILGKKVQVQRIKRTGSISSTKMRDAIASDKAWKFLTGKSVARLILKFNGIKRMKKAYNK